MPVTPLPPALHARLDALAARVRRLRVARGACWLAVAGLLSAAGIVLLDAALPLSVAVRCLLEVGWFALVVLLSWRLVVRPSVAEVPLEELARQIEGQFPGLGERLLSVVSLRDADESNGSPQLIASLARETEQRTREMDFARAAPVRPVAWLAVAAGVVFLAVAVSAAVIPGTGEQLRRVGLPWHRPAVVVPFEIVVPSGNATVRRGDPVTLSAYLRPTEPGATLPDAAVLVFRDAAGDERKLPMTGDDTAAFHVIRPAVAADFAYRVEADGAASEWFTVSVADPVDLSDQTTVAIAPPAYAASLPIRTLPGLADLDGLQYSTATLRLRFNRPAASAMLDWRPDGRAADAAELTPLALNPDATSATVTFRMKANGTLRILLVNESGARKLRTEIAVPVRVTPDAVPRFEQVTGLTTQPRTVRPGERVPIALVAEDDIAVAAAELEYETGPDFATKGRVPVSLSGANTPRAEGRLVFDLAGKGKEGDTVRLRLRITDNRRLDDPRLGPQEAVYPPGGWAEFRLSASAPPLDRQEIFGQRDAVKESLLAALKEVRAAQADAESLRTDTAGRSLLPEDHQTRITTTRERASRAIGLLRDAAQEAALTPELRPLAAAIRDIAAGPLKDADDALRKAQTDNPADRKAALEAAVKLLADAGDRIEALLRQNDRLAQDRLDRRRLDALAGDQKELADKTKPDSAVPPDELRKLQQELLDRLRKVVADSDPLKRGTDAAAGREARRLADDAKALAGLLRDLDAAAKQLTAEFRTSLLDALADTQARGADQAASLLARIETAARLAGVTPPRPEDFRRVTELLRQDKAVEALIELEKLAQALDRTAEAFEKWELDRRDAKVAAKQLAQWQDDLRTRYLAATKATPFEQWAEPAKAAFRAEQRAILRTTELLRLPQDKDTTDARTIAVTTVGLAAKLLDADGKGADTAMKTAVDALNRLADKVPAVQKRLAASRLVLDQIRTEQDLLLTAVDPFLKSADPRQPQLLAEKLAPWQPKQEKLARQLAALDLPGFEARHARAVATLNTAAADMKAGLMYDSFAALHAAKRELDRFKQALDSPPALDDRIEELARKQLAIADAFGDKPTPRQLDGLGAAQQELYRQLSAMVVPESPAALHDAQQAAKLAESAFRDGSTFDVQKRRTRLTAEALVRLSDRVNGLETDLDRVRRLAAYRRQAGDEAKKLIGKPFNADGSNEATRQIGREVEELTHTRVGAAGQPLKRIVLELYSRYRTFTEPDKQGPLHKDVMEALDRLAAVMADIQELAVRPERGPGAMPAEADAYLPSKLLADALRDMARQQRAVRDRTNAVNGEVAKQTRPAGENPLATLEQRQRALAVALGEFTRKRIGETELTAAEEATRATEAARLAADRLTVGQVRTAREAAQMVTQRLKQLATTAGARPWGKDAADLAATQEEILNALTGLLDNPAAAAAQQTAREEELAKKAFALAHLLERAAKNAPPGGPGAAALAEAAKLVHKAEMLLNEAAKKTQDGNAAEAEKLRADADKLLQQAADKAMSAASPVSPGAEPDAAEATSGDAIREADAAMKRATEALGSKPDPTAAERAMRQATDALNRASKATGTTPPNPAQPPPGPGGGTRPNGNTGLAPRPTAGALTPDKLDDWAKAWGDLPGDVKARVVQDLKAKYGEDYARSIKLYFEQLAERR